VWLDLPRLKSANLLSREQVLRCQRGRGRTARRSSAPSRKARCMRQEAVLEGGVNDQQADMNAQDRTLQTIPERDSASDGVFADDRSCRGEGHRPQSRPERLLDLTEVGAAHVSRENAEQERPYLACRVGQRQAHKAGRLKASGAGTESRGSWYGRRRADDAPEGRIAALIEAWKG